MKNLIIILVFLVSGLAMAQTTVTLQDQCNCEVLSGTAVTVSGMVTPVGADMGDIYVNTNTGTIYFWDGVSWELTSSDDQQLQNFSFDAGTHQLTLALENGGSITVDLSALNNAGSDDQALSLSGNTLTLEDGGTVDLSGYLDNTDDQNIDNLSLAGNILTVGIEGGTAQTVDLSALDNSGTDDQNLTGASLNTSNILQIDIEDGTSTTVDLSALNDSGTDDQALSLSGNSLTLEDGGTVDLSGYLDNTDDQGLSISGNTLTLEDGGTVDLSGYLDNTDDQAITDFRLDGTTHILTLTLEDGGTQTVDLSGFVSTDDQTITTFSLDNATHVLTITLEDGNTQTVDLSVLDNIGTDDQNISGSGLSGTDLTIGIENGTNEVVDLSSLVGTDDQDLSTDGTAGNISIEDGNSISLNVNDADSDVTNELTLIGSGAPAVTPSNSGITYVDEVAGQLYIFDGSVWNAVGGNASPDLDGDPTNERNTVFAVNAGNLEITDSGGTLSVPLSSIDTDDQTITAFSLDNATNILTITLEDGNTQTVNLSSLDNMGTDDQNLTLTGTDLNIENGNTIDLSGFVSTDDQQISLAGNTLTLEDGGTINLAPYFDNTDDQAITDFSLDGTTNILTLTLEDGGTQTVDLSGFVSTDDQNISGSGLTGTDLTIGIQNGTNEVVDLSSLANTDEQDLSSAVVTPDESVEIQITNGNNTTIDIRDADSDVTNELTLLGFGAPAVTPSNSGVTYVDEVAGQLYIYDGTGWNAVGGNATPDLDGDPTNERNTSFAVNTGNLEITDSGGTLSVPLSSLGTDDQNLTLSGTDLSIEDGNTIDLSGFVSTDDQNISGSGLSGTDLIIGIENGTNETVDLSSLVGTDDQALSLSGNTLTLEDGGTVNLSPYLDNTDDQAITDFSLDGATHILTLTLEDGGTQTVDLSGFVSTDDQNIENLGLAGNILTVGIEGGTAQTVDLSALDNSGTDDQNLTGATLTGNTLQIDIENGASTTVDLSALNDSGTDDQALSLSGNTLTLEDGGTVDLVPYLDNTDDQAITDFSLDGATNLLTITLEDGGTQTVDLSTLNNSGTDDQTAAEVNYDNTVSGLAAAEVQSAIDELAAGSTDDQNISGSGLSGTDLTIGIENGTNEVVDLSSLVGTDDQDLSTDGTAGNISIEDGNSISLNVNDADSDPGNEYNTAMGTTTGNLEITDNGGTLSTSLISADANNDIAAGTDGALYLNVSSVTIAETITNLTDTNDGFVTYVNESGTTQKVAKADITVNPNGTYTFTNNDGSDVLLDTRASSNPYDNTTSGLTATDTQAALDELSAGSTDDQNLTLSGTDLSIEDGNSIDLSGFVSTDDQQLTLVTNTLTLEDGGTVDLSGYLDNTDDQNLTGASLNASNILQIDIEDGTSTTVDLSALNDSGTDDQALSLSGNTLTLEDGGTVDLVPIWTTPTTRRSPISAWTARRTS